MRPAPSARTTRAMKDTIIRFGSLTLAIAVAVVVGLVCAGVGTDDRGVTPIMPLASTSAAGWVAVAAVWGAAWIIALIVGKLVNTAVGLFCAGCMLAVYAMRTGTVLDASFDGASPIALALTALVYAAIAGVVSWSAFLVAGPLPDIPVEPGESPERGYGAFQPSQLPAVLAAVAAVVVVYVVARTDSKGQAIGAMTLGALLAAMLARSIRSRTQPVLVFVAPALAVALAQLAFGFMAGGAFDGDVVRGTVAAPLRLMPMDVVAGSLCGVALGYGLTKSGGHDEHEHA